MGSAIANRLEWLVRNAQLTVRIHITGASGSGTSTLGAALANHLCVAHFDADNFY